MSPPHAYARGVRCSYLPARRGQGSWFSFPVFFQDEETEGRDLGLNPGPEKECRRDCRPTTTKEWAAGPGAPDAAQVHVFLGLSSRLLMVVTEESSRRRRPPLKNRGTLVREGSRPSAAYATDD